MQWAGAWLTDIRDDLPRIEIPVLIVHADADRLLPTDAVGRCLREALDTSRFVVGKNARHGLIWTRADVVTHAF